MSHHGDDLRKMDQLSEMFDELEKHQQKINGTYPDNKLSESDEGAISIAVSEMGGKVILAFGEPTAWIGLTPDEAAEMGMLILKRARQAGLSKPLTIEIG